MSRLIRKPAWQFVIVSLVISTAQLDADVPRFRFKAGATITYEVENDTTVAETVNGSTTKTISRLRLTKQWRCVEVDDRGIATIQLTLTSLRNEQVRPNGESLIFDSENPKETSPGMKGMSKYVGAPLAILRVDPRGDVVETKKAMTRFDSRLPFIAYLPKQELKQGLSWERAFEIVLDPPLGTGEKYAAKQLYQCKAINGDTAAITIATQILKLPESKLDRVPLLAKQPQGRVVFNIQTGLVERVELAVNQELVGHQGKNSRYEFASTFVEKLMQTP